MPARPPTGNPDNLTISPGVIAREFLSLAANREGYAYSHQYAKACMDVGARIRYPGGGYLEREADVFEAVVIGGHDLIIEWPEPESPCAPTITGRTPNVCASRGENCNTNPCFGCPNA